MPVDAEDWLASRGIKREPLRLTEPQAADVALVPAVVAPMEPDPGADPVHHRVADPVVVGGLEDAERTASGALGFIRRSTTNAPQSEGRLRSKLLERGYPEAVIDEALLAARGERIVDDPALLAALIAERRMRGHADLRLRRDLRDRGFTGAQVDDALSQHAATDPAAAVFALARDQAARLRAVDAEAAVRRTVGYLVRRGHSEAFARKAARDAVYADREAQQVAGR